MFALKVDEEITLTDLKVESAKLLFELIDSNRNYLREWLSWVDNTNVIDDTILYIQTMSDNDIFSERFVFEIHYKDNLAGLIDFNHGDRQNNKVEIGYWLAENYQGKGIITKSCMTLINYAFEKEDINRIAIKCAAGNKKSSAIPLRLNFNFEGIEREAQLLYGVYQDILVYSLLKKEWK